MDHTVIYDCEFLTAEGAPQRFWCGPHDPDPVIAQIGLVKVGLSDTFPILDTLRCHVIPRGRDGARVSLDLTNDGPRWSASAMVVRGARLRLSEWRSARRVVVAVTHRRVSLYTVRIHGGLTRRRQLASPG